jgi:hypothetical protein
VTRCFFWPGRIARGSSSVTGNGGRSSDWCGAEQRVARPNDGRGKAKWVTEQW